MDLVTLFGLAVGIGGILLGNAIEGGSVGALIQSTAFMIVFGGTLGAVFVSNSREDLRIGFSLLKMAFRKESEDPQIVMAQITQAAQTARKESILALEAQLGRFSSSFMQRVFRMVIDGVDAATIRDVFENEIALEEERLTGGAKIWGDAGGFAPTIGIIGAVLGLISVMSHLTDTSQLGKGIAVAFVATVYGVGSANLVFLPLYNKIKRRIKVQMSYHQMVLEGAVAIVNGMNPYIIEEKLYSYMENRVEQQAS